jgi:3-hydroxyisobutyrate dehydrogenase-like beta-hydroxyacid dehydrogenase
MNKLRIGIIGLGIMGMAYACNLIKAGYKVSGFDICPDRCKALDDCGGTSLLDTRVVTEQSDIVLVVLASANALELCVVDLSEAELGGKIICEMGTFSLEQKMRVHNKLEPLGAKVLDCPVSGTGAQAIDGDLSIYLSGEEDTAEKLRPVFKAIARDVRYVGPYGTGIKLKLIANLLVTVHNLAAAEALLLAKKSGLDLQMVYDAICQGAGTSRMFEIRGQMMIDEQYEPATMKHDVFTKDLQLIIEHACAVNCPIPLMASSLPYYYAAISQGRGKEDTASVYSVLKSLTNKNS